MGLKLLFKKSDKVEKETCVAVVPAAGTASRMDGLDKLFLEINDVPIIVHTLEALSQCPDIDEIIVTTREDCIVTVAQLCKDYGITKVSKIIKGGDSRLESVLLGVRETDKSVKLIAIHDAARPFVTQRVISDTIKAARKYSAAAPAVPVKDTIKTAENGIVSKTLDRRTLFAVQTPQIFDRDLILSALSHAKEEKLVITDDCSAVEAVGMRIVLTDGDYQNIKITTPDDLVFAHAIFNSSQE